MAVNRCCRNIAVSWSSDGRQSDLFDDMAGEVSRLDLKSFSVRWTQTFGRAFKLYLAHSRMLQSVSSFDVSFSQVSTGQMGSALGCRVPQEAFMHLLPQEASDALASAPTSLSMA